MKHPRPPSTPPVHTYSGGCLSSTVWAYSMYKYTGVHKHSLYKCTVYTHTVLYKRTVVLLMVTYSGL